MPLSSMTGFARVAGRSGAYVWNWELKSVNGKGLELRLRLPPGWDALEIAARQRASAVLRRGTIYGTLNLRREGGVAAVRVNEAVLAAVLGTLNNISGRIAASPPRLDGILALKGVLETVDEDADEEQRRAAETALIGSFAEAVAALVHMRREEGAALGPILAGRLADMQALTSRAEGAAARRPEIIKARLAEQVAALLETSERFDADRLHQEAILIAGRLDVREELDRLAAHVQQARGLLQTGGPVGRRLDFLAQELNREANTLCAKSNDVELTNIGLELKSVVEQFREQVQNLE